MSNPLNPTELAIEYLRRDKNALTPAEYLKRLNLLKLEFEDLLTLSHSELKEEIDFAWRLGIH
ncbi:YdiH family protein [Kosakonia cowanii]|uniref:YdiH family protein n=1 Tax=Kosakonia cowanii TaxID=208223 RepID=UPI003B223128